VREYQCPRVIIITLINLQTTYLEEVILTFTILYIMKLFQLNDMSAVCSDFWTDNTLG